MGYHYVVARVDALLDLGAIVRKNVPELADELDDAGMPVIRPVGIWPLAPVLDDDSGVDELEDRV
jgi:hypothetical protein